MKKGLIIGKFLPLHNGHIRLIEFGSEKCDTLTVMIVVKKGDPIDCTTRQQWLETVFEDNETIEFACVEIDLISDQVFREGDVKQWCELIEALYPDIDCVISSETYGDYLADHMAIEHIYFDAERVETPISGTQIRQNPEKYRAYMPEIVRKYFNV